jgi:hypothetical protein
MIVGAVLLATGCGGSSKSASSAPTTGGAPTTAASSPGTKNRVADDQALAQQAVLRLDDLPAGYKSTPTQNTPADDVPAPVAATFSACTHVALPIVKTLLDQRAGRGMVLAASPNFVMSESDLAGTVIASAVEVHPSATALSKELDQLGAPAALGCWKAFFTAAVSDPPGSGSFVRALEVTSVPLGSLGDQNAAVGATITAASGGRTVNETIDFCIVRRARADALLMVVVEGGPVDRTLERSLLVKMVSRLQATAR